MKDLKEKNKIKNENESINNISEENEVTTTKVTKKSNVPFEFKRIEDIDVSQGLS